MTLELRSVTVADVMSPGVISCPPAGSIGNVASVMDINRIHCVVVPDLAGDRGGRRWGLITDQDLMAACMTDAETLTARDIAAADPVTVNASDSLARACQLMVEHGVSHLIVVADGSWPAGVLSSLDVARVMADIAPRRRSSVTSRRA